MKILPIKPEKVSFQGYRQIKDEHGIPEFEFSYPFDENVYNCFLEIYNVEKDKNGNYRVTDLIENTDTPDGRLQLKNGKNKVDLAYSYFIDKDTPFAYHYKLEKKNNPSEVFFRVDSGDVIDNRTGSHDQYEVYNYVTRDGSRIARGGSMKLVIPDNFNADVKYDANNNIVGVNKAPNTRSYKHFSNKMGGSLAGIELAVKEGEFNGYSNIISLPIFTDDSLSAHGYWNKNCMQIIPTLGNINNYASLQRAMFGKGINWVSDGAFVNEGLEGVHFANMLRWGDKSPYYNWFNASGLENGPFLLGVFGKNTKFITHKLVNSPYNYLQFKDGSISITKNDKYDSHKPTYVQIFDSRLASREQRLDNTRLIKSYDNLSTDNPYEINTHDDTVINYHFEINPETYHKNVKNLIEYNKTHPRTIRLFNAEGTRFVNKYEFFELENKIESNFETWDANTDIAKLNYVYSPASTERNKNLTEKQKIERNKANELANCQVRDYVVTSGMYWTQKTKDILTLHTAQQFKNVKDPENTYKKIIDMAGHTIPKSILDNINRETVQNILNGDYVSPVKLSGESFENQILEGLMNYPLDATELGDNTVGVLASPFITKRASTADEIGKSRYEIYREGDKNLPEEYRRAYNNTQKMYENEMADFAKEIINSVQKELPSMKKGNEATLYGKYVLPLITQEIAKFAVIKSLQPNAKVKVDNNGEISYNYKELKEVSLQDLGIFGASPEDEALSLVNKMRRGIPRISDSDKKLLTKAIVKSLDNTNEKSFALANAIVDLTQSGLDWRIDATKDIADIDALRDSKSDFEYTWQQVTDFWKDFNKNILKVNPNAYLVAEVTDERSLHSLGNGGASRISENDIIKKFLNETGMTATANYNSFFTDTAMMFGKKFEMNTGSMERSIDDFFHKQIFEKMAGGEDYLRQSNLDSLLYSYTFLGNHDKPRALHCFALDMQMFYAELTMYDKCKNGHEINEIQKQNPAYPKSLIDDYRRRAFRVLNNRFYGDVSDKEVENYDFSRVSSKAIAMAETMMHGFGNAINELPEEKRKATYEAIAHSISDLAKGRFFDKNFNADAFAVKPFDVTINSIISNAQLNYNFDLKGKALENFENRVFDIILEPAFTRLLGAMKILNALPGKPTLYSGDDLGETGFEEKTKNIYLQNRGYQHREWIDSKPLVKTFHKHINNVLTLRSRPELDALNNGAPYTLPIQKGHNGKLISGIFRQNTDGRMAITLFNTHGMHHDIRTNYSAEHVYLDCIDLNEYYTRADGKAEDKVGLKAGIKPGTIFRNAINPSEEFEVFVHDDGGYHLHHRDGSPICINDTTMILFHDPEYGKRNLDLSGKHMYKIPSTVAAESYKTVALI